MLAVQQQPTTCALPDRVVSESGCQKGRILAQRQSGYNVLTAVPSAICGDERKAYQLQSSGHMSFAQGLPRTGTTGRCGQARLAISNDPGGV